MNRLLQLPQLFSVIPIGAQEPYIQCPGWSRENSGCLKTVLLLAPLVSLDKIGVT